MTSNSSSLENNALTLYTVQFLQILFGALTIRLISFNTNQDDFGLFLTIKRFSVLAAPFITLNLSIDIHSTSTPIPLFNYVKWWFSLHIFLIFNITISILIVIFKCKMLILSGSARPFRRRRNFDEKLKKFPSLLN